MNLTFALTDSRLLSDSFSVKKEARAVTTKKWVKAYSDKLSRFANLLYTSGTDKKAVIKTALVVGYGDNIGNQIFNLLTDQAIEKMATNIKTIY